MLSSEQTESQQTFPLIESGWRYRWFRKNLDKAGLTKPEYLIPQIEIEADKELPDLMKSREDMTDEEAEELKRRIAALDPWNYSIHLGRGIYTGQARHCEGMFYRSKLITGAVERYSDIKGATAIDLACNHGYMGLELASRGAKVVGTDLREKNVQKARLMAEHFRLPRVEFKVEDVYDTEGEFDIVYNLGLLYHVTDPYRLVEKTYRMARRLAVIDTVTHHAQVSAFIQRTNKNVEHTSEGAYSVELHPTYRAVIDLMHAVGFKSVFEVVQKPGENMAFHRKYADRVRRCFLGVK